MHASELLCRRDSNGQQIQCRTSELTLINKVVVDRIWLALTIPSLNIISKLKEQAMPQASEPCRSTLKLSRQHHTVLRAVGWARTRRLQALEGLAVPLE